MADATFILTDSDADYAAVRSALGSVEPSPASPVTDGLPEVGVGFVSGDVTVNLQGYDDDLTQNTIDRIVSALSDLGEVEVVVEDDEEDDEYVCDECEESFDSPQKLGGHKASHS